MSSSYYPTPQAPYTPGSAYTTSSTYNPASGYTSTPNYAAGAYSSYPNYSSYVTQTPTGSQYQPSTTSYGQYYPQTPQIVQHPRSSPPPVEPPSPPDYSSINPQVASKSVQRLIGTQLLSTGFEAGEISAMNRLEREVICFVERLYERAHELANLANRSGPIVTDLLLACEDEGLDTERLKTAGEGRRRGKKKKSETENVQPVSLTLPDLSEPLPDLLPSDDEDVAGVVLPTTLRGLPHSTPALPPKHTYLRTPVSPLKKAALPSLEKKLKNAALVQESLKNLMLATEDNPDDEDGELLGAIVNGQVIGYQRKRWRLNA